MNGNKITVIKNICLKYLNVTDTIFVLWMLLYKKQLWLTEKFIFQKSVSLVVSRECERYWKYTSLREVKLINKWGTTKESKMSHIYFD